MTAACQKVDVFGVLPIDLAVSFSYCSPISKRYPPDLAKWSHCKSPILGPHGDPVGVSVPVPARYFHPPRYASFAPLTDRTGPEWANRNVKVGGLPSEPHRSFKLLLIDLKCQAWHLCRLGRINGPGFNLETLPLQNPHVCLEAAW